MVTDSNKAPTSEGRHYIKIDGVWTLKHDIRSPKFYEILKKIYLKGDTAIYLKNLYNHIMMCLNAVTII